MKPLLGRARILPRCRDYLKLYADTEIVHGERRFAASAHRCPSSQRCGPGARSNTQTSALTEGELRRNRPPSSAIANCARPIQRAMSPVPMIPQPADRLDDLVG